MTSKILCELTGKSNDLNIKTWSNYENKQVRQNYKIIMALKVENRPRDCCELPREPATTIL